MIILLSYEWRSSHPCDVQTNYKQNPFTAFNSFWFTVGSLMVSKSFILPYNIIR